MKIRTPLRALCPYLLIYFAVAGCSQTKTGNYIKKIDVQQSGYVQVDQGTLFFRRFGSGEPIVVLHGGPGLDQNYLLPQMLELAKDRELIFYDQRGSGNSLNTKIDSNYINLNQFTQDLEDLRLAIGLKKFVLLGHSWGGLLAMDYATKHPQVVSSLILLNPAPADYAGQKAFINEFAKRIYPIKDNIAALFHYEYFVNLEAEKINKLYRELFSVYFNKPDKVKYLTLDMSKESAQSGFKVMREMSKTSWLNPSMNLFPALKHLPVPTLIIHGKQDIIPADTAQEIKNAIPNAQIVYLEYCGHFPYIEKPEALFAAIRAFLTGTSKNPDFSVRQGESKQF